jgi:hypothetical protein
VGETQRHTQDGDAISLLSFLESRLIKMKMRWIRQVHKDWIHMIRRKQQNIKQNSKLGYSKNYTGP